MGGGLNDCLFLFPTFDCSHFHFHSHFHFRNKFRRQNNENWQFSRPQSIFCWFCEAVLIMTFCGFFVRSGQYIGRVVSSNDRGKVVHCTRGKVLEKYWKSIADQFIMSCGQFEHWACTTGQGKGLTRHIDAFDRRVFGEKQNKYFDLWWRRHACKLMRESRPPPFQGRHVCGDYMGYSVWVWGSVIFHCV